MPKFLSPSIKGPLPNQESAKTTPTTISIDLTAQAVFFSDEK